MHVGSEEYNLVWKMYEEHIVWKNQQCTDR